MDFSNILELKSPPDYNGLKYIIWGNQKHKKIKEND